MTAHVHAVKLFPFRSIDNATLHKLSFVPKRRENLPLLIRHFMLFRSTVGGENLKKTFQKYYLVNHKILPRTYGVYLTRY